jgi:hypothetical protein
MQNLVDLQTNEHACVVGCRMDERLGINGREENVFYFYFLVTKREKCSFDGHQYSNHTTQEAKSAC